VVVASNAAANTGFNELSVLVGILRNRNLVLYTDTKGNFFDDFSGEVSYDHELTSGRSKRASEARVAMKTVDLVARCSFASLRLQRRWRRGASYSKQEANGQLERAREQQAPARRHSGERATLPPPLAYCMYLV
jgi:hypothetical protein